MVHDAKTLSILETYDSVSTIMVIAAIQNDSLRFENNYNIERFSRSYTGVVSKFSCFTYDKLSVHTTTENTARRTSETRRRFNN